MAQRTNHLTPILNKTELIAQLSSGQLLVVDSTRRSGLIIQKRYHSEFAGPGSAVGGFFDIGVQHLFPIGDLTLVAPASHAYDERQQAFATRRQWLRLIEQLTERTAPLMRASLLLERFSHYFDPAMIDALPNDVLASLIGVMPTTMATARQHLHQGRTTPTPALV
jgi:hypothetical protein